MGALHTPEFWVAVGFLILMGLLIRPALRAGTAALDGRAERIRTSLDDARALYEEAQHVLAEYQRKQRDAARDVDDIVAHARVEAERMAQEAGEKLTDAIKRREQQATDKIAQAEADAIAAVRNAAVDIAIAATRRILAEKMDEKEQAALIDQAIGELSIHLH
jgi:F-type H+-transporting ATPase subunit b